MSDLQTPYDNLREAMRSVRKACSGPHQPSVCIAPGSWLNEVSGTHDYDAGKVYVFGNGFAPRPIEDGV